MKQIYLAGLLGVVTLYGYADAVNGQSVRLNANQQTVDIALPANATTGYQWFVQNYDHDLLILQDYRYVPKSATKGMTGVGGTAIFTFSVDPRFYDGPQITEVNFVYEQPWNPNQNTNSTQVTVLSTSSSNDSDGWQKYPDNLGPGAAAANASLYDDAVQIQASTAGSANAASASAVSVSSSGAMQVGGASSTATSQSSLPRSTVVPATTQTQVTSVQVNSTTPVVAVPTSRVTPASQAVPLNSTDDTSAGGLPVSGANNQWLNLSPAEASAASNANATASKSIPANTGVTSSNVTVPAPTSSSSGVNTSNSASQQTGWLSLPSSTPVNTPSVTPAAAPTITNNSAAASSTLSLPSSTPVATTPSTN